MWRIRGNWGMEAACLERQTNSLVRKGRGNFEFNSTFIHLGQNQKFCEIY